MVGLYGMMGWGVLCAVYWLCIAMHEGVRAYAGWIVEATDQY